MQFLFFRQLLPVDLSYCDICKGYNYMKLIIDCMPSLGMMTINALTAADSVLIPVQTAYLPVNGLT